MTKACFANCVAMFYWGFLVSTGSPWRFATVAVAIHAALAMLTFKPDRR